MEDFVPYKLAVKLKEKGFRNKVNAYYGKHENIFDVHPALDMNNADYRASAPTIAEVLKWLRENKEIHICINIYDDGLFFDVSSFYKADTGVYEIELPYMSSNVTPDYESYELAALAGIEYVLNYLI